jgi:hypothetical protein
MTALAQTDWKPLTLDAHQNETVIAVTDILIPSTDTPGAKDARVNRYIDLFLTDGPGEQRAAFVEGLAWLDGFSRDRHGKTYKLLSRDQQVAVLTALDGESAPKPGADFFRLAKRLTVQIYYATEIGQKELNKGGRVPASFACQA